MKTIMHQEDHKINKYDFDNDPDHIHYSKKVYNKILEELKLNEYIPIPSFIWTSYYVNCYLYHFYKL